MLLQSCFRRYPSSSAKHDRGSSSSDEEGPSTSAPSVPVAAANRSYPLRGTPSSSAIKNGPSRSPLSPSHFGSTHSVPGRPVLQQTGGPQRQPPLLGQRASRVAGRGGVAPSSSGALTDSRPVVPAYSGSLDAGQRLGSSHPYGRYGLPRHDSGASSSRDSLASSSSRVVLPSIPTNRAAAEPAPAAPGRAATTGTDLTRGGRRDKNGLCEKCDKDHDTADCPYFKKPRDNHPDALRRKPMEMGGSGGNFKLASARVVRQPGDGSCLFHSIAYGLGNTNASRLRRELAEWVEAHPDELIAETPLRDWVKWDSASNVRDYARRMAVGGWGGGIEMAACARLKRVNVHVYERIPGQSCYKRISCFDAPGGGNNAPTVHVLYQGGVHFDALVPSSSSAAGGGGSGYYWFGGNKL